MTWQTHWQKAVSVVVSEWVAAVEHPHELGARNWYADELDNQPVRHHIPYLIRYINHKFFDVVLGTMRSILEKYNINR